MTSAGVDQEKTATSEHENTHVLHAVETVKSAAHAARAKFHVDSIRAVGPSRFFNPTSVYIKWKDADSQEHLSHTASAKEAFRERAYKWRSRDHRKGRNSVAVPTSLVKTKSQAWRASFAATAKQIGKTIFRMCTTFPYWDMAFWSGSSYSLGSVLFIIDGVWEWKDVAMPGSEIKGLTKYGGPLCFFFGALLYELGAVMAYLEAVNDGSFQGSAMRRFLQGHEEDSKRLLDDKMHSFFGHMIPHRHHHKDAEKDIEATYNEPGWNEEYWRQKPGSMYSMAKSPPPRRGAVDHGEAEEGTSTPYTSFRWWPTWHALRTHHLYEIGYWACAIQLFGATLYGMMGVVDLPGIFSSLANWQAEAAFWIPDIVASVCFLTASIGFTLETHEKWLRPEPGEIGWWIGIWAIVGSVGFL